MLLSTLGGLLVAMFLHQLFTNKDWDKAVERSYFSSLGTLAYHFALQG